MHSQSLTVETLTDLSRIESLVPEWESLAMEGAQQGFFRKSSWYMSWIRNIRPDAKPLVVVVRHASRIVAIAPFCTVRQNRLMSSLVFGGSDLVCGEYLDIVSLPEYRQTAADRIFESLRQSESTWDLAVLNAIHSESALDREVRKWTSDGNLMLRTEQATCPFMHLPATFDEYLAGLGGKRRKHLVRAMHRFEEQGVTVKIYTEPHELGSAIDKLIELHLLRWKSIGKPGTLGRRGYPEFLKELASREGEARSFRLFIMEHEGSAIAAMLNFHFGGSALQYQNGFDPYCRMAPHSPGTVLILHGIRAAIQEGLGCYDFLRGREAYKFQFARQYNTTTTMYAARTLPAKTYLFARDVMGWLTRLKHRSMGLNSYTSRKHPVLVDH